MPSLPQCGGGGNTGRHTHTHIRTHTKAHTSTQANPRDADANTERHNTELYNVHRFTHTHKGI